MGTCLSKKTAPSSSSPPQNPLSEPQKVQSKPNPENPEKIKKTPSPIPIPPPPIITPPPTKTPNQEVFKKEVFIIKHRKSHEIDRQENPNPNPIPHSEKPQIEIPQPSSMVRTSSCTKEEVDAILIQCGRLSRSSSTGKAATGSNGKKYSGSKRSFDFDAEIGYNGNNRNDENDFAAVVAEDGERIRRNRHREPRHSSPSSSRRRRTPSRERDGGSHNQRSGSKERGSGNGGGRRVSRSPGRRSESPSANSASGNAAAAAAGGFGGARPGKMVSVPATVNSIGGGDVAVGGGVKRIQVKRNVGESPARTAASPRSRSPARGNIARVGNENQNVNPSHEFQKQQQQPLTLSRSNSRKAEQSPFRRNPLGEIDNNVVGFEQSNKAPLQKPNSEKLSNAKVVAQAAMPLDEVKGELQPITSNIAVTVVHSGAENLKPIQAVVRSRSSRLSRDLDINPETLLNNNNPSYTSLLLEDIQNFHQKNAPQQPAFSLPACVTKACSILEAVADLNSTTSTLSNLSVGHSEEKKKTAVDQARKDDRPKDPFVESEMSVNDDLMEPSLHKYVTVRRGVAGGVDIEEQESSGSNSYVAGQQLNWLSPSSWEPNSADSTDCWTSSRRDNDLSPLGFQRNAVSETGREKKRELEDHQRNGIGRHRLGAGRNVYTTVASR